MEGLTRLVAESLARYGLDRPVDYRRLQWSRWIRCESPHSLLCVPSKPGVFALAEDVMANENHGGADAFVRPVERSSTAASVATNPWGSTTADELQVRRMLAVLQFGEDDDMAFVLDRMLSRENPMRARLVSGRCFVRYVVIEDATQRRTITSALNQWLISSGEKASGIGAHFATSLELNVARACPEVLPKGPSPATASHPAQAELALGTDPGPAAAQAVHHLDSGSATNIHCPQPLPSGF